MQAHILPISYFEGLETENTMPAATLRAGLIIQFKWENSIEKGKCIEINGLTLK